MKIRFLQSKPRKSAQDTFKEVFDLHYEGIRNFIYYKTADTALAEDVAQETFLKYWEKRDTVREETLSGFLYTVAGNLLKTRLRKQSLDFNFVSESDTSGINTESPEYEAEFKEFEQKLQKAVADLPETAREVFLMNRIDGMTYAQIAEALQISVKAVEKRMSKALAELRETIKYKI